MKNDIGIEITITTYRDYERNALNEFLKHFNTSHDSKIIKDDKRVKTVITCSRDNKGFLLMLERLIISYELHFTTIPKKI